MDNDITYKIPRHQIEKIKDISTALLYGTIKSDRRVQLKMPAEIVDKLDELFPNVDRSKLITQLAIQAILLKAETPVDDPLKDWMAEEPYLMKEMFNYLDEREKE